MLVDDEIDIALSLKRGLELHGFSVDAFERPQDALAKGDQEYAVAILDVRMPGMSGFELYHRLRRINSSVGVFFMTAFEISIREFRMMFPGSDVVGIMSKPISIAEIEAEIEKYLATKQEGPETEPVPKEPADGPTRLADPPRLEEQTDPSDGRSRRSTR